MFRYGRDIPLDDAVGEAAVSPEPPHPVEPMEFVFTYGKDIFPQQTADNLEPETR